MSDHTTASEQSGEIESADRERAQRARLELNPAVQSQMMLAAAVSQLSAAIWGLAAAVTSPASSKGLGSLSQASGAANQATGGTIAAANPSGQEGANAAQDTKGGNGAPQLTYGDVQAAINAVGLDLRYGHDGAVEILSSFGVSHGKALKPEQYAAVVARCQQALAGASH